MSDSKTFAIWAPRLRSVLRMVAGFLFMWHGTQKLFGFPVAEPRATVDLMSQMGLAGVIEVFGGLLILLGLFTRPVALIAAVEMLWAYVQAHLPRGPWPILNGGELALLYSFIFLYLGAAGPGPWSLDALRHRPPTDRA